MYHAWYLGVDFQLYAVLTPIFVTLYTSYSRKITILLELSLLMVIVIASMVGTFRYKWSANLLDGSDSAAYDRDFYINPFFRASPYIIGFIAAQLWHEKSRLWPNFGLRYKASTFISLLSVAIMAILPFWGISGYHKRPCLSYESPFVNNDCGSGSSRIDLALYISFMRPIWGLGLAMLSLLSFNGQFNALGASSLLEWSGWNPISKLSFGMYLLHPLVGNLCLLGKTSKIRYSNIEMISAFASVSTLTFFLALVVGILVEWPLSKITRDLEKKIWSTGSSRGSSKSSNNPENSQDKLRTDHINVAITEDPSTKKSSHAELTSLIRSPEIFFQSKI